MIEPVKVEWLLASHFNFLWLSLPSTLVTLTYSELFTFPLWNRLNIINYNMYLCINEVFYLHDFNASFIVLTNCIFHSLFVFPLNLFANSKIVTFMTVCIWKCVTQQNYGNSDELKIFGAVYFVKTYQIIKLCQE